MKIFTFLGSQWSYRIFSNVPDPDPDPPDEPPDPPK